MDINTPAPDAEPRPAPETSVPSPPSAPLVSPPEPAESDDQSPIMSSEPPAHKLRPLFEFLSTLGVLIGALVVALCLIAFVFQSYEVDGPSMESTLHNQDRLIVWKTPRTWARLTRHSYIPQRGDIIVFVEQNLTEFGQGTDKQLIKRVIGLPGDRVVVRNGAVTIYNAAHPNGFKPDKTLGYGKNIPTTDGNIDLTLGKSEIFVCGDNRPNSLDSRSFGPVNVSDIVGKLVFRILPLSQAESF